MMMIAILARRPCAISAVSIVVFEPCPRRSSPLSRSRPRKQECLGTGPARPSLEEHADDCHYGLGGPSRSPR
eukprot:10784792-Heterocapsa_arctica.AAC.2